MKRIPVLCLILWIAVFEFAANNTPPAMAQAAEAGYAFIDVSIVTMVSEEVLPHQIVIVAGERIVAIGPLGQVELPAGVVEIDGADRYLIPGLIDAHIHLVSEHDLSLLLAHGVTTVRNMNGRPQHLAWRDAVKNGVRHGPQIITAGPMLGELPQHLRAAQESGPIAERVAAQAALGYDFCKVGDGLSTSELTEVVEAAQAQGLDVVGHVPDGLRVADVLKYGLRSIEHLDGLASVPAAQLDALFTEMAAHPIWVAPTLTIWQQFQPTEGEMSQAQTALVEYLALTQRTSRCLSASAYDQPHALSRPSASKLALVAALHRAGVPLLLGTDAPFLCTSPGESIHQELRNFTAAGLTPYEALRTATVNPAAMLHLAHELGTVEVGKQADLLLLARNPLEDVSALRGTTGVLVQGEWLPAAQLQGTKN